MKTAVLLPFLVLSLLIPFTVKAQENQDYPPFSPDKSGASPLFGKDIVIYDDPTANQENLDICTAFNGWMFAAFTYQKPEGVYAVILQSTDNGLSWTVKLNDLSIFSNTIVTRLSLTTSGNSISTMKLFMGVIFLDTNYQSSNAWVGSYEVEPFTGISEILNDLFTTSYDIELCNDFLIPAAGSNPNSIGVLYSKSSVKDSIIFRSSSNGGTSLDSRRVVTVTSNHVDRVALSYGACGSFGNGKYYAAWEEKDTPYSEYGHLYTAHSEPGYNSPFTTRICLDSLDNSLVNQCKDPSIACQYSDYDNDSANLTAVVLFETTNPGDLSNDIKGFYNLQSTTSNYFRSMTLAETGDNEQQQDISFNPYDSTFMVTFYNATLQELPFLTNNVNLNDPDSWVTVSAGYNDENSLVSPYPGIILNYPEESGACAWISQPVTGNGSALFDAFYSTYTGSEEVLINENKDWVLLYPNPARSEIHIVFTTDKPEQISITLFNLLGQSVKCIADQEFDPGKHAVTSELYAIPAGSYFISFQGKTYHALARINIVK